MKGIFVRIGMGLATLLFTAVAAAASTVTYYYNDLAGSPVIATDAAGTVIWRESYHPYGARTRNEPGASDNKVWFTSRRQDAETGLVYMGARYYDPVIGRFISTDPAGFDEGNLHSFNRYAYANNNPHKYVDPDGRWAFLINVAQRVATLLLTRGPQASVAAAEIGAGEALGAGGAAVAIGKGAKAGSEAVDAFRAVSKKEAEDIAKHGLRPDPSGRSMTDKWFSESERGAREFQKMFPELEEIAHAKVPREVYDRSYKHPNIDGTGPGFCVKCADLKNIPKPEATP